MPRFSAFSLQHQGIDIPRSPKVHAIDSQLRVPVAGVSEDRISQNGQKSSQIYVRFGLIACVIRWRQQEHSAYVLEFHRELFHWAARRIRPEFQASTWSLFWRTSVEGESIADAARELGLSIGAAYAARCRILARLKKTIEELDDLSDC